MISLSALTLKFAAERLYVIVSCSRCEANDVLVRLSLGNKYSALTLKFAAERFTIVIRLWAPALSIDRQIEL
jgi:hypothetical protein